MLKLVNRKCKKLSLMILNNFSSIMPVTAHAAFDKAAEYFGLTLIKIPVDSITQLPNPRDVEKAITSKTILVCHKKNIFSISFHLNQLHFFSFKLELLFVQQIVGSAPQFPHGVIDPIQEMSAIALKHKIGFHTDACLGGFLLPWLRKAG